MVAISKLKRWETWDRILAIGYGSMWLVALVLLAVGMTQAEPVPGKWTAYFVISFAVTSIAVGASLLGIWRHRRGGFIGLLLITILAVAGGQFSPSGNSFGFWVESVLIAGYCITRMFHGISAPKPPPLPKG